LFLLKLISKKEGEVTYSMARGKNIDTGENIDTEGKNISPSTRPVKVEQLVA
jgi:hypothetical protein